MEHNNRPKIILGINPGARYIGVALFHGAVLRDWSVKVIKGEWSKEKMDKIKNIVSGIIERYQPDVLAIKKHHPARSSDNVDQLVEELKNLAADKKLPIFEYPIKDVEAFLSPTKKVNKYKLAALMAARYSELFSEWEREKKKKEKKEKDQNGKNSENNYSMYYMRMFEAVFVAYVCFRQLDRHSMTGDMIYREEVE